MFAYFYRCILGRDPIPTHSRSLFESHFHWQCTSKVGRAAEPGVLSVVDCYGPVARRVRAPDGMNLIQHIWTAV